MKHKAHTYRWALLCVTFLLCFWMMPVKADAKKEQEFEKSLHEMLKRCENVKTGLKTLQAEIHQLETQEKERMEKLSEDIETFQDWGSSDLPEDHMFYLTYQTHLTPAELDRALEGTGLEGLGLDFYQAERDFGVNSLFLVALANHESAFGNSYLAQEKNNLFGFNANDANPYGDAFYFETKGDCVRQVAEFLHKNYLSESGVYYNGISTAGVNVRYCTTSSWTGKIDAHMVQFANKVLRLSQEK